MSDPILSGLLNDSDQAVVTDVLGRQAPVSMSGQSSLPVGGAPVSGGAGPVAPGGTGVGPTFTGGGRGATQPGPDALGGKLLGLGERTLEKLARSGLGDSQTAARNPETEQAFQAQRAGERADLTGAAATGGVPSTLASGASPTTITGEFSPEIQALVGGAGSAAVPSTLASGAPLTSITGELSPEIAGLLSSGGGAGAGAAGAAGAAGGAAASPALSAALAGIGGVWAGPLLSFALSQLEPARSPYTRQREKAYSKLGQEVQGGFMPSLQEAVGKGPDAVQKLLTPENLKQYGLEVQQDPQSGEYIVGLSSVGHPYVRYEDALNAQTQLSQSVNQALQLSRAVQLMQPSPNGATSPEPTPPKPPTTPAGGGPLGLAEIGLEVGR